MNDHGTAAIAKALAITLASSLTLGACGESGGNAPAWDPDLEGTSAATGSAETTAEDNGDSADTTDGETADLACMPGEVAPCACPDGLGLGEWICEPEGLGFGPCTMCDGGDPGTTTGDPGDSSDDGGPMGDVVCYPGMANDFTTCLPLHAFDLLPAGYEYLPAYMGNPNYRPPVALIDLEEVDPATWLAPNFQLVEIAQASKGRYAIVQPHAIVSLQALRDSVGPIGVNSGYRSPAYNAGLSGSATYSRHMYGDGFDLNPIDVSLSTLEGACGDEGGMLVEYTTHVHCDFRFDDVDEGFFGSPMAAHETERPNFEASLVEDGQGVWHAPAEGFDEGVPQRRWTARDAQGAVIVKSIGPTFSPPPGTATVEVRVGAQVERAGAVLREG